MTALEILQLILVAAVVIDGVGWGGVKVGEGVEVLLIVIGFSFGFLLLWNTWHKWLMVLE
jgi:hypothetical protein